VSYEVVYVSKHGNIGDVTLDKWLDQVKVMKKQEPEWDLSPTTKNKELIEQIIGSSPEAQILHKSDIINQEFIYLGYRAENNDFNTLNLVLWDKQLFVYMTGSSVIIEKLSRIPINDIIKSGHLLKIKFVEKISKSKKRYLDVEVTEL
jgi:hypothetical protein